MATSPTLREVQQGFAQAILDPAQSPEIDGFLVTPPNGSIDDRITAYSEGYPSRIEEALSSLFPATQHLAGNTSFCGLARGYASSVPQPSYSLSEVGDSFPNFLRQHPLMESLPFLGDLCELELRIARSFHARDRETLDPNSLQGWSEEQWETAVVGFQPSVFVLASDWPLIRLWEARNIDREEIDIDLAASQDHVLVRRAGLDVVCETIDADEYEALQALLRGAPLGAVMESLAEKGISGTRVSSFFSRWMQLGLITSAQV